MSSIEIVDNTVSQLSLLLSEKKLSSVEITQAFIDQTNRVDDRVHAFLHLDEKNFLKQAEESDERRKNGKTKGKLDGIPIALKDVISVEGQPLTAASKILENYISPYDATVTRKLKDA